MILSTTYSIPGQTMTINHGLVRGNTIRARHLGRDIVAGLRAIVGGEISDYTKMMAESREQALDRMTDQARKLGADAILMTRFATSSTPSGASEMLAYGTAVKLKKTHDE